MKPIDMIIVNENPGLRDNGSFTNSSPSKISKLSKHSKSSLIYRKKVDRLMHSIKVQCVCDYDCNCHQRFQEEIEEETNINVGDFHPDWEDFIDQSSYIHQLKVLKSEGEYVPSRWRMKETDMVIKIDDVM